jgi:opacity protein-like surface antigen
MPFAGVRVGGEFRDTTNDGDRDTDIQESGAFGLALRMQRDAASEWEILYSRQRTETDATSGGAPSLDLDVEYLHFGGTFFPTERNYAPYVLGGLGVTRFSPKPGGLDDATDFSLSLGGGMRFPLTEAFALRLEARGFLTFVDADTAVFCISDGGGFCAIQGSGSTLLQFEAVLGFAFSF